MDTPRRTTGQRPVRTRRKRWTTIVLEERDDGEWLATQTGVSVEARGTTAADAAAEYCRQVAEGPDE